MRAIGVIQCRMSSSRLPGKALLKLKGKSILEWVILRCQRSGSLQKLILATSNEKDDDLVAAIGEGYGIPVVRGSKENVLRRYLDVIAQFPSEAVVRITADNPLTDPSVIDNVVAYFFSNNLDYSYAAKIPYGTGADVFKASSLGDVLERTSQARHLEHINTYFLDNHLFYRICSMTFPENLTRPDVRVTVDTPEDFQRILGIFEEIDDPVGCGLLDIIGKYDFLSRVDKKMF